jgi:ParB/RepB/Spo0J family partition protein
MPDLAIELIDETADNLRRDIGDVSALAQSIRAQGILQPLLVSPNGDRYQVVAGSRRLAAAKHLGLPVVPVVIREMSPHDRLVAMLVENLQRGDLSPIEEAEGYARLLVTDQRLTQRKLAAMVGVAQSTISKRVTLLDLPVALRTAIHDGRLPLTVAEELHRLIDAGLDKRAEILGVRIASGALLVSEKRLRRIINDELGIAGQARVRQASARAHRQQGELVGDDAGAAADDAEALARQERLRLLREQGLQECPTCQGRGAVPLRPDEWQDGAP